MITVRIFNTPIKIKPIVLINLIALWAVASWVGLYFHPERDLSQSIVIGFFAMLMLLIADFGHALAHIFSARRAGAPMDEIRISAGMPQTIYLDNDVTARAHIMRSLGGPAFSLVGTFLSLLVFALASKAPLARELATWSLIGQGFIFVGSLLPLPIVDGGAILKWSLVRTGLTEEVADRRLRQVNLAIGIMAVAAGIILLVLNLWVVGLVCIFAGALFIAVGVRRIF